MISGCSHSKPPKTVPFTLHETHLTGEPCAEDPQARFGGRGDVTAFPTPMQNPRRPVASSLSESRLISPGQPRPEPCRRLLPDFQSAGAALPFGWLLPFLAEQRAFNARCVRAKERPRRAGPFVTTNDDLLTARRTDSELDPRSCVNRDDGMRHRSCHGRQGLHCC